MDNYEDCVSRLVAESSYHLMPYHIIEYVAHARRSARGTGTENQPSRQS